VCGTWPTDPHADDGIQHGGSGEGGVAQARLRADGGQPFEGPQTRRLAKGPGTLGQDRTSWFALLSVQDGLDSAWYVCSLLHTRETTRVKRVNDVPHRLRRTASGGGELRGFLALRTGKHDLAAAHGEGIMTTQPSRQCCALFVCDVSNIPGWFHSAKPLTESWLAQIPR
jgi:hypothetical protein